MPPPPRFPDIDALPRRPELPDPLVMLDGRKVTTKTQWFHERRPELIALFQHYMYGVPPPPPRKVEAVVRRTDPQALGGKATLKEITLTFDPKGSPPLNLLLVVPNNRGGLAPKAGPAHPSGPAPVVFGLNFRGNHTVLPDPAIALSKSWMPFHGAGTGESVAIEASRGTETDVWSIEQTIDRGWAVATLHNGDIDPDRHDWTDGVHPAFYKPGQTAPGPHEWGTIAAWSWGLRRVVDYLVTNPDIDAKRMVVFGHSRNGKTALLTGALDERIAAVLCHQSGCGGAAPSRGKVGETVKQINDRFPHWFNDTFARFNNDVEKLPMDQHALLALCAPRPVLYSNAVEDQWANPEGQFEMLKAAEPVHRLLGTDGFGVERMPEPGQPVGDTLGYFIRPGQHSTTPEDWKAFIDFAERNLK